MLHCKGDYCMWNAQCLNWRTASACTDADIYLTKEAATGRCLQGEGLVFQGPCIHRQRQGRRLHVMQGSFHFRFFCLSLAGLR